jgi:hypothetical protein
MPALRAGRALPHGKQLCTAARCYRDILLVWIQRWMEVSCLLKRYRDNLRAFLITKRLEASPPFCTGKIISIPQRGVRAYDTTVLAYFPYSKNEMLSVMSVSLPIFVGRLMRSHCSLWIRLNLCFPLLIFC